MYDELIKRLRNRRICIQQSGSFDDFPMLREAADAIEELQKRKRGKWKRNYDGIFYWWECSECHHDAWYDREDLTNFCPSCGAEMERPDDV